MPAHRDTLDDRIAREDTEYLMDMGERTLRVGRLASAIGTAALVLFVYLDHQVLGSQQMLPVRLVGIVPLVLFLIGSFTVLPQRPFWVVRAHAFALTAIVAEGCMVAFWVFSVRPDNPGWQSNGTAALFVSILGVFALAGGARRYMPLITGAPIALLLVSFLFYGVLKPGEWLLFLDPAVAAVITIVAALYQERIIRREFAMRWLAEDRKRELEAEVAKHKRTAYQLQRQSLDLRNSNEELDQFANTISHDLREPLRVVAGFLGVLKQQLERDEPDAEKVKRYITQAVDGAERMDRLISDLLSYARVGTRGRSFRAVELDDIVADARKALAMALRDSGGELVVHSPLPRVIGDGSQLLQLVQNLLGNGLKYCKPDDPPRVEVSAEQVDSEVFLRVRDNGIGIAEEHHEKIFDILRRLHTRDEYPGTGMGLAICKKIVDRHGGSLEVASTPGEGTTFTAILAAAPRPRKAD